MGLRIQNNVEAFNAHRNLTTVSTKASKAMEKLSSGYRINRAADDAAGLAISEKMRAQIGGIDQAQAQRPGRHLARPDGGGLAFRSDLDAAARP
jgi:flagellin